MAYNLLPLLALLTLVTSNPILERAGGPAIVPIPPNCTLTNPLPNAHNGTASVSGYKVSPAFTSAHLIFSAYFEAPSRNESSLALQCFEQCNGFEGCVSAFLGHQMEVPDGWYGHQGVQLASGCLFYGEVLEMGDFVRAREGEYLNLTAGNRYCPDS